MKVKIYQLEKSALQKFGFMDYDFNMKHGLSIADYKAVYTCERKDGYTADKAYTEFNLFHPTDFTGHSLSVSDIVELDGKKLYCDPCGWVEVK